MNTDTIKFYTIKFINGTKYLSKSQINDLQHIICTNLSLDKTSENFKIIEDAIEIYFKTQITLS